MAGRILVAAVGFVTEIDSLQQLAAAVFPGKNKKKIGQEETDLYFSFSVIETAAALPVRR